MQRKAGKVYRLVFPCGGILPDMPKEKIVPFKLTWDVPDKGQKKNVIALQKLLGTDIPVVVSKALKSRPLKKAARTNRAPSS